MGGICGGAAGSVVEQCRTVGAELALEGGEVGRLGRRDRVVRLGWAAAGAEAPAEAAVSSEET